MLLRGKVKKFNANFVENLYKDVLFLQAYADTLPLPGLSDIFQEIFQCVMLLRSERMEDYLDDRIRSMRYNLVKPADLLVILDKYRDSSMFSFKKNDRHKSIELVIKALKAKSS